VAGQTGHGRARGQGEVARPKLDAGAIEDRSLTGSDHPFGRNREEVLMADSMAGMSESLELSIVYEDGGASWIVASIPQVPGTHSQGRTRQEARANVIDALEVMLAGDDESLAAGSADTETITLTVGS
jgi:predicted RNase H-like HicB family nuclease